MYITLYLQVEYNYLSLTPSLRDRFPLRLLSLHHDLAQSPQSCPAVRPRPRVSPWPVSFLTAEEIVEKKADDKAAIEGLEGETVYQKILSLLGKCQRDFQVNEKSKIWWDAELDRQVKEVRKIGRGMSHSQRANKPQQWAAYRREAIKMRSLEKTGMLEEFY